MMYLEGELELMSPSIDHEGFKKRIARLVEEYAVTSGIELDGYGSWTIKRAATLRGAEPDECYILRDRHPDKKPDAPDLAIEVDWSRGGLDKLEIYRGLGVREVWMWRAGRIDVHHLEGEHYVIAADGRSRVLPDLDLRLIARLAERENQREAVLELRALLTAPKPRRAPKKKPRRS